MPFNHSEHDLYCVACGKKTDMLIDGRFCSDECRDVGQRIEKGSSVYCNFCGINFKAKQAKSRFCPEHQKTHPKCACFYPAILKSRKMQETEKRKAASSVCVPKELKRTKKAFSKLSIAEVNELARASGLSYGQYVGKFYLQYNVSSARAVPKQKKEG